MAFIQAESYIKQMNLPLTVYVQRTVLKKVSDLRRQPGHRRPRACLLPAPDRLAPSARPAGRADDLRQLHLVGDSSGTDLRAVPRHPFGRFQPGAGSVLSDPDFWTPSMLGRHQWAADLNPLFHYMEIVRRPLMGQDPSLPS